MIIADQKAIEEVIVLENKFKTGIIHKILLSAPKTEKKVDGINSSAQNSLNLSLYVIRRIHENNSMIQTIRCDVQVYGKRES